MTASVAAQPVIWSALGYQFEAASMIAGLSACLMVRVWVSLNDQSRRALAIDLAVTAISVSFTAGWIMLHRPEPFYALLSGTGFGALGAGIITLALAWIRRLDPLVERVDPTSSPVLDGDRRGGDERATDGFELRRDKQ